MTRVLHPRKLLPLLRDRLSRRPIVVLTGSRQTGKTTLVRDLLTIPGSAPPVYISLDDPDERLRLAADPVSRLDYGSRLVILDEIQKQPALLDAVKFLVDRRRDHPASFLLLGSSQILLLRQVRETLAGRAALLELWPLALIEYTEGAEAPISGLELIWREGESALDHLAHAGQSADWGRHWRHLAEDHLRWGGYPALEALLPADRSVWLLDFRRTYLERDLADLGQVADLDQFALAQKLLAARTGQLLSYSEVSRELGVAVNTVKRYVRFLEISYQVSLLRPLLPTVAARLVKSPKLYWTDTGLARLLGERHDLSDGPLFESHVYSEILRWCSWQSEAPQVHFYRTHAGREVDFIVHQAQRLLLIEAKASTQVHVGMAGPLKSALEDLRPVGLEPDASRLGLVVARGREIKQLAPRIWAIPDWQLFAPAP